jgi:hypothetical protein
MTTNIITLRSKSPDSLKQIITSALAERLQSIESGIKQTESRIKEFEIKYQLSTEDFLRLFNHNQLAHNFDFDEWIGEVRMLDHLKQKKVTIEEVEFVN